MLINGEAHAQDLMSGSTKTNSFQANSPVQPSLPVSFPSET